MRDVKVGCRTGLQAETPITALLGSRDDILQYLRTRTFAGIWLIKRINGPLFYKIINWLMILLGARLLWAGIFGAG